VFKPAQGFLPGEVDVGVGVYGINNGSVEGLVLSKLLLSDSSIATQDEWPAADGFTYGNNWTASGDKTVGETSFTYRAF
jgi:alanine racemase